MSTDGVKIIDGDTAHGLQPRKVCSVQGIRPKAMVAEKNKEFIAACNDFGISFI